MINIQKHIISEAFEQLAKTNVLKESSNSKWTDSLELSDDMTLVPGRTYVTPKRYYYSSIKELEMDASDSFRDMINLAKRLGWVNKNLWIVIPKGTFLTYQDSSNPGGAGYINFIVNNNLNDVVSFSTDVSEDLDFIATFKEDTSTADWEDTTEVKFDESVNYPNGELVTDIDLDTYLDYYYGEDRDKDNNNYSVREKQRATDYWFKKNDTPVKESKLTESNIKTQYIRKSDLEDYGLDRSDIDDITLTIKDVGDYYSITGDPINIWNVLHRYDLQWSTTDEIHESKLTESNNQFDIHAVLNANGDYEDLTKIVKDPSKIIIYDTWDLMLKDRDNLHTYYIRQNGAKEYEVIKYSKWSGNQYFGYIGPQGYSSLKELYDRNPGKYDADDVCLVKEFHIEEKLSESKLTEAPMDIKDYAARLRARKAEKGQNPLEKINAQIDPDMSITDQLQVYFDELVPAQGKADTVAGELVRAMMRVRYRDYNDGDLFYSGYGKETCGGSVVYLMDKVEDLERPFSNIVENQYEDQYYTEELEDATYILIEYLNNHPELFTQKNEEDSRNVDENRLDEYFSLPLYEFEPDTSYDESYYAVSDDDIDEFIRGVVSSDLSSGDVNRWARDGWTIVDLDKEDYDTLQDMWDRWFRDFLVDYERQEEDEYEDEEDFEESLTRDNLKRGNDMNKVAEDFELNNLEKMGTNEYEANKNRDKHIKMYRKFANISDSEPITEETINEYALNKTATYCNREPDRIKAEILGQRYSEYEQE